VKQLIGLILLFVSFNTYAFNLQEVSDKIADFLSSFIPQEKVISKDEISMPLIPQVDNDPTSVDTYKKTGVIYSQGRKFKKLKIQEKRQYQLNYLKELFEYVRGGVVSESTLVNNLNVLEQGGSRVGIFRSVVLDARFSQLESYRPTYSKKLLIKVSELSLKYLGQSYPPKQLRRFNKYTIKRIFIDKFLQILDTYAFENKPESIYTWYAHLSRDMAEYKIWANKTRENNSLKYHYNWAKNVPFEHIKSEVIIKLAKLIEYLSTTK
jgi:hypothetical protein